VIVEGKSIYVSPEGDDSNSGLSEGAPLKGIAYALTLSAPGDEVRLLPGTYEGKVFIEDIHGSPENPITIMGHSTSDPAIIDGGGTPDRWARNYGIQLAASSWIDIENIRFQNCWARVIELWCVEFISIRGCYFDEGQYPIYLLGDTANHHILVEDCYWEGDERIYTTWDWAALHHGDKYDYNGSFFAAEGGTNFVIRYNIIKNAFDGIQWLGHKGFDQCDESLFWYNDQGDLVRERPIVIDRRGNTNFEIYGNLMVNTRDNAIEPEQRTANLHIYNNVMINSHAFISIDHVQGGPIYFYGNVGYMTEDTAEPWTIFKLRECDAAWGSDDECYELSEPFYVFNNSWYANSMAIGGGGDFVTRHLKHYNNAYYFSQDYYHLDVQNWGVGYEFDYDFSNVAFPNTVLNNGGEIHGIVGDPKFADMVNGDFRLRSNSPCIDQGKALEGLTQSYEGSAPDIGAYEGDKLVEGPPFVWMDPGEKECFIGREYRHTIYEWNEDHTVQHFVSEIYRDYSNSPYIEKPRIVRHKIDGNSLILWFSLALNPSTVDAQNIFLSNNALVTVSVDETGRKMTIHSDKAFNEDVQLNFEPLPLGVNGDSATFWASTITRFPTEPKATTWIESLILDARSEYNFGVSGPFNEKPGGGIVGAAIQLLLLGN